MPVSDQELRFVRVDVDGPVQVTSAVKVVFQAQREVVSEVTLVSKIRLLRGTVLKIFSEGKPERLNRQRHGRSRIQISLSHEDRRRIGRRIEPLLIWQIIERRR